MAIDEPARTNWTFVTNHARVLAAIARDPGVRLRDVAQEAQLTERAVQAIVTDLEQAGYLARTRTGRRNHYEIATGTWLRHPAEAGLSVSALLDLLAPSREPDGTESAVGSQEHPGSGHAMPDHRLPEHPLPDHPLPEQPGAPSDES
ncbi:helix-turn-helix domain-containing protein [Kitasatospora sp. NPDC094015]|uniref:helix-turn-helix transcriptional regulator n=1 Tax=Kitasatospora sp. NPDC094015 TaxID=3155205 RepID=UPI00331C8E8F